jgi:hypothetical protein
MADDEVEGGAGDGAAPDEAELGAAVDDAVADEVRRMRARFVAQILGVDRAEGVGRGEEHWNDSLRRDAHRDVGQDPPDEE